MKKIMLAALFAFTLFLQPVFAEVITSTKTEGYEDYIYVVGDVDNFPIEFYDKDSKSFKGIIPDLLKIISEDSGVNFVYFDGDKSNKDVLGEDFKAHIISSADGLDSYGKEYLELISYDEAGKTVEAGLIFTSIADDGIISDIKNALDRISQSEKNGICLSYAEQTNKNNYWWLVPVAAVIVLLLALIVVLYKRINRMQNEYAADKMIDAETGIGNLQYFKYNFKYTINDVSRSLYHVAYIILDSSYLRSYYGDNSFEDVVKYTSSVLSEHTSDLEIAARITESGFVFAFRSVNDEEAKERLKEVMNKLNSFEEMKKNNKIVFHAAVYHLASTDKNCEILLFNLRNNCNKTFGTDIQILYCDTYSMNFVQEEKKITESILKGFENNEFKMYLQFVVDNKTKKIVSAEALSRWDRNDKGILGPYKYIKNMEATGLISKHDFYMFDLACRQLEKWKDTEFSDISISCNFTRITLSEDNFFDKLNMIISAYSFDKSKIAIEITEDAIETDIETAAKNVMLVKELGLKVYLDDLGSGYTSLSNLCEYPIDVVKIDRDILIRAESDRGKSLFTGIIALAHSLNVSVICEGVENVEQNTFVSESDCDFIQGWYYSKPLPLEECETFIENF